jgi:pyruvate-formate lyase-activating enzyme
MASAKRPSLVFANRKGEILDYDGLEMAGSSAGEFRRLEPEELIPLPEGSELFVLPGRLPVGIEAESGEAALLDENPYDGSPEISAVAAFMAPAHTAIYSAAYQTQPNAPLLPLFAYTAVGWQDGRFVVAAFRSDSDIRQDPKGFNQKQIDRKTAAKLKQYPHNRLIQHLGKCCLTYACPAARNYFLGRWEAPLPTSPCCNAGCIGCISQQPSGCCPSTQERIHFVPSTTELLEIAVPHLEKADRAVVSFGQGCEGEPLLQAPTLESSIRQMRAQTSKGTINLNSNASIPAAVDRLAAAGLDSIRVSMNSARLEFHRRYYRPKNFSFAEVRQTIEVMKKGHGRHVSLNYFILPGFTDDPDEYEALCGLLEACQPDLIQLRNLNMDPEHYLKTVGHAPGRPALGILRWLELLKTQFPRLKFGYFNPALR